MPYGVIIIWKDKEDVIIADINSMGIFGESGIIEIGPEKRMSIADALKKIINKKNADLEARTQREIKAVEEALG